MSETNYRLLNAREVQRLTAISHATLYRLVKAGRFPKPIRVGPNTSRWRSDEIAAHLERLSTERDVA